MKKFLFITVAFFLLTNVAYSQCEPISSFPWTEGFENIGTDLPPCWEQEVVSGWGWNWNIVSESVGTPATAHGGVSKAQIFLNFLGLPVYTTRLISPVFDLSAVDDPVLNFWHTQTGPCQLVVCYRNSPGGEWVLLHSFYIWEVGNIPDWQEEVILLPEKSDYYQIAFEGIFLGGGIADLQLDDVSINGDGIYEVVLLSNLPDGGSISGGGSFFPGTRATVTANPNTNFNFVNWTKAGLEVSTDSEYSFSVTENMELIANFEKSTVGILETIETSAIKIYPNPTGGKLKVVGGELQIESIEIFDAFGKKVDISHTNTIETTIDISHLSAGTYFVKIKTAIGGLTRKIIKE
jgi:hypothetical protein